MAAAAHPSTHLDELVRLIAHDLRNPLTAVQLNGQLLEQAAAQAGLEKQRRWAGLVVDGARRMDDLLGKLVESERLRSGQMALARETVVLTRLVPDVVLSLGERAAPARVLSPPEPLAVPGDRNRIGQALAVLARLAAQEADPDAEITIEVAARDGMVACSIRAPRPRRAADGEDPPASPGPRGILEHFARSVVECHGGTLRLQRADDAGLSYEMELPSAPPEP